MSAEAIEAFRIALRLNKRQKRATGAVIGLTEAATARRFSGEVACSDTELLAMTTAAFDLPAWSADLLDRISPDSKALLQLAARAVARDLRTPLRQSGGARRRAS